MPDNLPTTNPSPDALTLAVWAAHAAVRRGLTHTDGMLRSGRMEVQVSLWGDGEWHARWTFDTSGILGDWREGYEWDEPSVALAQVPA